MVCFAVPDNRLLNILEGRRQSNSKEKKLISLEFG